MCWVVSAWRRSWWTESQWERDTLASVCLVVASSTVAVDERRLTNCVDRAVVAWRGSQADFNAEKILERSGDSFRRVGWMDHYLHCHTISGRGAGRRRRSSLALLAPRARRAASALEVAGFAARSRTPGAPARDRPVGGRTTRASCLRGFPHGWILLQVKRPVWWEQPIAKHL